MKKVLLILCAIALMASSVLNVIMFQRQTKQEIDKNETSWEEKLNKCREDFDNGLIDIEDWDDSIKSIENEYYHTILSQNEWSGLFINKDILSLTIDRKQIHNITDIRKYQIVLYDNKNNIVFSQEVDDLFLKYITTDTLLYSGFETGLGFTSPFE